MDARIRIDHELVAVAEHSVQGMIELNVPEAPSDDRRPLDIALVVDRSGRWPAPSSTSPRSARDS